MVAARSVLICGDGVAGYCCAHLLKKAGFEVVMERADRPRVPAIMLSQPALDLLRDVFEKPQLFADQPRIDWRVVAWGGEAAAAVSHTGVVVSEKTVLEQLAVPCAPPGDTPAAFTVYTAYPLPRTQTLRFGSRNAAAVKVELKHPEDASACQIETLEDGWLFLIPAPPAAWLLAVGGTPDQLLAKSRLIAPRIDLLGIRSGEFDACPRIVSPVCGEGWLACGTVAMAVDPICGDGTAQAVREAILASAAIKAIAGGGDAAAILAYYDARLTLAMYRHLGLCAEYYRTGGSSPWWQGELEALLSGSEWCVEKLKAAGDPQFQLRGFDLLPYAAAS